MLQVLGAVYVDRNSRQVKHYAGLAGGLRGGVVGFEAIVAKAEGEQVRGAAKSGVGAASVAGRQVSHDLLAHVLAAYDGAGALDLGLRQAVDALVLEPASMRLILTLRCTRTTTASSGSRCRSARTITCAGRRARR